MTYMTKPFFDLVYSIVDIYPLVILLDIIGIILILFKERFEPRTFVIWLMIIIVLPVWGFVIYLLLGCTIYSRKKFKRKWEEDSRILSPKPKDTVVGLETGNGLDYAVRGNTSKTYWNLGEYAEDAIRDIGSAKESVLMEARYFPKNIGFERILDALSAAAERGVDVRVLTGARGFGRTKGSERITRAGGKFRTFHKLPYAVFSIKNRNRLLRGILVVDGRISYTGLECVVRIEGTSAVRSAKRFAADWSFATKEYYNPELEPVPCGDEVVQITSGGPDAGGLNPPASEYMGIINQSKKELFMTFQYLVPDEVMYNSIRLAVHSGADVRILVPRRGKHWYQGWNSLAAANPLMLEGAHVYFTDKRTFRNVIVSDGSIVSVGSAVFNSRSMRYDFTTNAVIFSERLAEQTKQCFLDELSEAVECHPEEDEKRSFMDRLKIVFSRMMMFFN